MTKSFFKVIAAILVIIMLWAGAMATDYLLVFEKEEKPIFCLNYWAREDVLIYNGIGYSYTYFYKNGIEERVDFENILGMGHYLVHCI